VSTSETLKFTSILYLPVIPKCGPADQITKGIHASRSESHSCRLQKQRRHGRALIDGCLSGAAAGSHRTVAMV
jgi:hypothetical protein